MTYINVFIDTYSNMKTTIEISDSLLETARQVACWEKTTVRALVEEGLRRVIAERERSRGFRLRKATFRGAGSAVSGERGFLGADPGPHGGRGA